MELVETEQLNNQLREIKEDIKDIKKATGEKFQEIFIKMESTLAKKEDIYPKGELDRIFSAIQSNTQSVKELMEKQDEYTAKSIVENQNSIKSLQETVDKMKSNGFEKLFGITTGIIMFILGLVFELIFKFVGAKP